MVGPLKIWEGDETVSPPEKATKLDVMKSSPIEVKDVNEKPLLDKMNGPMMNDDYGHDDDVEEDVNNKTG